MRLSFKKNIVTCNAVWKRSVNCPVFLRILKFSVAMTKERWDFDVAQGSERDEEKVSWSGPSSQISLKVS